MYVPKEIMHQNQGEHFFTHWTWRLQYCGERSIIVKSLFSIMSDAWSILLAIDVSPSPNQAFDFIDVVSMDLYYKLRCFCCFLVIVWKVCLQESLLSLGLFGSWQATNMVSRVASGKKQWIGPSSNVLVFGIFVLKPQFLDICFQGHTEFGSSKLLDSTKFFDKKYKKICTIYLLFILIFRLVCSHVNTEEQVGAHSHLIMGKQVMFDWV